MNDKQDGQVVRRRMPPDERRAQLLEIAMAVFANYGIGQAHHAQIAKAAEVSVSTVFVYFPTRDALISAVLDEVDEIIVEICRQAFEQPGTMRERLINIIDSFGDFVDTHPSHACVWLEWSTAVRQGIWPRYLEFQDKVVQMLAVALEEGRETGEVASDIEAEPEARLLVANGHTIAQLRFTKIDAAKVEQFKHMMVRSALGHPPDGR